MFKLLRNSNRVSMTILMALHGALLNLPFYFVSDKFRDALIDDLSMNGIDASDNSKLTLARL